MRAGPISGIVAVFWLSSGAAMAAADLPPLAPYQMVRSLQLAQDRIADGDQAALPMQKKMITLIDRRLRKTTAEEFADKRNLDALMIYGMSGGNPQTFEQVISRLHMDQEERDIADGILAYFRNNPGRAAHFLASASPGDETPEVGAFLALIKGTVRSIDHPSEGLALLDQARLLAPGSLVEEAALRRSITLAADTQDPERFLRASEQYVRRFLKSPYASHFADGFINGVVAMHGGLDMARVKLIIDMMNADQQTAVYLRIARKSAIQGQADLAEFASTGAEGVDSGPDPRAELYNALATVTSDSIDTVSERLAGIDPRDLSARDVRLLEAAKEVVKGVRADPLAPGRIPIDVAAVDNKARIEQEPRARPPAKKPTPGAPKTMKPEPDAKAGAMDAAQPKPASGQPKVRVVRTERIPAPQAEQTATAPAGTANQPSMERMSGNVAALEAEPEMELVVETRKKLDDIDKLLEEGDTQ